MTENTETRFVSQLCESIFFITRLLSLCAYLPLNDCTDCRTRAVDEEKPKKAGEETESPKAKRRKQEEKDLSFLQVKNKDGHICLFVDLGEIFHKPLCVLFYAVYDI